MTEVYNEPSGMIRIGFFTIAFLSCFTCSAFAANGKKRVLLDNITTTRARVEYLEDQKRIEAKQPDVVLNVLGVKPGDIVADVGCGTGVFTFPLADKVGKDGKVYAVEILDDMLAYIDAKMKKERVTNIALVKSSDSDPNLPPACCDKILLVDTYQDIGDKLSFFTGLRKSLKNNGSVAIITVSRSRISPVSAVIREMESFGFKFSTRYDFLGKRYFLVFK